MWEGTEKLNLQNRTLFVVLTTKKCGSMSHTRRSQPLIGMKIGVNQKAKQHAAIARGNAVKEETKESDECEAGGGNKVFDNCWISLRKQLYTQVLHYVMSQFHRQNLALVWRYTVIF